MEEITIGDALWVVALTAATFAAFLIWAKLEKRKLEKVERAAEEAARAYRRAAEEGRARTNMKLRLNVHHEDGEVRILIWDAEPYFEDQVEGVLVPFHIAKGATIDEADADFRAWLTEWLVQGEFHEGRMNISVVQ